MSGSEFRVGRDRGTITPKVVPAPNAVGTEEPAADPDPRQRTFGRLAPTPDDPVKGVLDEMVLDEMVLG